MANTYTQIHIQYVFAVKYRQALIDTSWENELYKYITGIIQNEGHKLLAINGMPDHLHIFVGQRPIQSCSDLMQTVKSNSSLWINNNNFTPKKFSWQEGYGAFSYTKTDVPKICNYVFSQKTHHHKKKFLDEYRELLKEFEIDFDENYIFKEPLM